MTVTTVATNRNSKSDRPRQRYIDSPAVKEAAAGSAAIHRGHSGEDVQAIQRALNAAGANPPLAEDGLFGPKTEAALKSYQRGHQLRADGIAGRDTVGQLLPDLAPANDEFGRSQGPAFRAPQVGAQRPSGSVQAGELARREEALRRRTANPTANPTASNDQRPSSQPSQTGPTAQTQGPTSVTPAPGQTAADARLQGLQQNAVRSAERELAAGVREEGPGNRGARVDQYARNARMPEGGEWCGYFTQFNYSQAARETGGNYQGVLHSFQKARSDFTYRDYTNNSANRNGQLDQLQRTHQGQGSARRFMVLEGSSGQEWAQRSSRTHETYQPNSLPIRAGDTALFNHGHVAMVQSYDRDRGILTTVEGNVGNRVVQKTYDLNDPRVRARFEGFGRPAAGDFGSG